MIASSATPLLVDPSQAAIALAFEDVEKAFKRRRSSVPALRGMTFSVPARTITGLVGPDGAGKTTIMRLSAGLLAPDRGRLSVFGVDPRTHADTDRGLISYMPQRFGLYEDLTVGENLQLFGDLQGIPSRQRAARYERLMEMTGLSPFLTRRAGRLSGGMQQKLGLACTLVRTPRLLLLDEPTAGVDPVSRQDLWSIIKSFVRDEGVSVLMSTAYMDEAERCDQVIVAHEGHALAAGSPRDLTNVVAGRTWSAHSSSTTHRALQRTLERLDGVIDVSIRADSLHVLTARDGDVIEKKIGDRLSGVDLEPTPARLEDTIIAMLTPKQEDGFSPVAAPDPPAPVRRSISDEPVISVENATRAFGSFLAVDKISFEVRRGEVFGLLGANGAGKTTTFRMLCGLLPPTSGRLHVAGIDLRSAPAVARGRIGYVSQHFALYGELTVFQNLRFFASAYGLRRARRRQRIDWALDEFDLRDVRNAVSGSLPLGFGRRLAMACALMHEPDVLFLDEATSGVDPLTRRRFWRQITALAEGGMTVLVTTHHVEEAEYCDQLVIMVSGRVARSGSPAEVRGSAQTPGSPPPSMDEAFLAIVKANQHRENGS